MPVINPKKSLTKALKDFKVPKQNSHKGQNGRVLVIGGSKLFHAASLWACQVASYFVDLVHYCSTKENQQVFINLKSRFTNGIIIQKKHLINYIKEDDCILIGPGMIRTKKPKNSTLPSFDDILKIDNEGLYTYYLTKYLLTKFKNKKFIIDAGALQMVDLEDLGGFKYLPILTPQTAEFKRLFGINLDNDNISINHYVIKTAKKYRIILLVKKQTDYCSDGTTIITIKGGNSGLTKGGTGDILAGLCASFYTKQNPLTSTVLSSYILKASAERLAFSKGIFYNIDDIIITIPEIAKELFF